MKMIKLKKLLKESITWNNRKFGERLPTMDDYKEAYNNFGPRMVWGSDFPVVKFSSTYKQTLEVIRSNCEFISGNTCRLFPK